VFIFYAPIFFLFYNHSIFVNIFPFFLFTRALEKHVRSRRGAHLGVILLLLLLLLLLLYSRLLYTGDRARTRTTLSSVRDAQDRTHTHTRARAHSFARTHSSHQCSRERVLSRISAVATTRHPADSRQAATLKDDCARRRLGELQPV